MEKNDLDAILVTGSAQHNPAMFYFAGGAILTHADLIYPKRGEPILFHGAMERDEALKTGLPVKSYAAYDMKVLRDQANGDRNVALALQYRQMFSDAGVTRGRVSVYGKADLNKVFPGISILDEIDVDLEFVGEPGEFVLLQAMATKDLREIDRIRQMGVITTAVVGEIADFIAGHRAKNGVLVKNDGTPLRIRDVKRRINRALIDRDAENPHDCIFAIGYDSAVPHSSGNLEGVLELGKTIVFDIFPCEAGGGYHYDFTRTWCLGYAPDPVQAIYEDVFTAYHAVMNALEPGAECFTYQEKVCDIFEARGHKTIRQDPQTESGYVHGLGHGVGLNLHEVPWFWNKDRALETDILHPGSVVTIEPGLYYPEQEIGCRLEDTVAVMPDGSIEILAPYPLDLVLPVKET